VKHWRSLVVSLTVLVVLVAIAKPTYDARLSWYERGDDLAGANLLVTCLSGTPIFMYGGLFPWDGKIEEPFLSDFEVSFACRTLENNARTIASNIDPNFGGNRTFDRLVNDVTNCNNEINENPLSGNSESNFRRDVTTQRVN
jgi:hypothetical protein